MSEESNSHTDETPTQNDDSIKFEERYEFFMGQLSAACDEAGIKTAFAFVVNPENPKSVLTFQHGEEYDQAKTLAGILRALKDKFDKELAT